MERAHRRIDRVLRRSHARGAPAAPRAGDLVTGRLDGRAAIVTGGARGRGASHAERLAREGARG